MSRRKRMMDDLNQDIRDFIERETGDNIGRGLPPDEARYAALRKFGNVTRVREDTRAVWTRVWLEQLLQDLRFAGRTLRKSPGFAAAAVLTLALGIGVSTSIFSLVYSLALRPLPVNDPASIVSVYEEFRGHYSRGVYGQPNLLSYPEYLHYRDSSHVFSGLAASADVSLSLGGATEEAIAGVLASCDYFDVLGGRMARGRGLSPEDCRLRGAGSAAVISSPFWKGHFGGDPGVLGKTLTLNRRAFVVVGVAASNFSGPELQVPDVWLPLSISPEMLPNEFQNRNWLALGSVGWLNVVGRLKPGISHRQAEAELAVLAHDLDLEYPGRQTSVIVNSGAYWNSPEMRRVGGLIAAAILALGGFILGIACMNVMTLLLARACARYQEFGVRLALGAGRLRLVRQLLTESILLAFLGGSLSVLVAQWLPPLLVSAVPEMPANPHVDLSPNWAILIYSFLASVVAAAGCGLAPTLQASRSSLASALKEQGSPVPGRLGRSRLRSSLIVAQVAGCTVLLVVAGLLVRGLHRAQSTSPGFTTKDVMVVSLDLANKGYDEARAAAFERQLQDRLASVPGVAGVARTAVIPWLTGDMTTVTIPGRTAEGSPLPVQENMVSADYFQTMGIHLLRGRAFTEQEAQAPGSRPAVISAAMARRLWGDQDPTGREFLSGERVFRVVGIAPDVQSIHPGQTDGPFFYGASAADDALDAKIMVRVNGNASSLAGLIPNLVRQLDLNAMASTDTLEQALERALAPSRTLTLLITVLGILALVLAVVGVWGIVAYAASQRTHEIGIRKALGARQGNILTLLLGQGAKLAAIGLAIGITLGAAVAQALSATGLLFGLSALDAATYLTTALLFVSVTLIACYVPARQALRVDPMVALRYE